MPELLDGELLALDEERLSLDEEDDSESELVPAHPLIKADVTSTHNTTEHRLNAAIIRALLFGEKCREIIFKPCTVKEPKALLAGKRIGRSPETLAEYK